MPQKTEDRDYRKEYDNYHSKPKQRKNRSTRNKARRKLEKKGKVKKGDGKEVDHRVPLSKGGSNHESNLEVKSRTENRKKYTGGKAKKKSTKSKSSQPKQTKTKSKKTPIKKWYKKKYNAKTSDQKRRVAEKATARKQPSTSKIRSKGVTTPKTERKDL